MRESYKNMEYNLDDASKIEPKTGKWKAEGNVLIQQAKKINWLQEEL